MPSSIRKALNEPPATLDETYERALQEIREEKRQHVHRLFQYLVVAIRPLPVEELAELFAIEFDPDAGPKLVEGWRPENLEDAVLSACSNLAEKKDSNIVQFTHFSVGEFLTSHRLRTSYIGNIRNYHIPLDTAHTILARACFSVLLQFDENVDKKRLETFPLAFYAAQHWVDHVNYGDVASRFHGAIEELFDPSKPYLASWIWIHDVDSNHVRKTIETLEERPKWSEGIALYQSLRYAMLCGFDWLAKNLILTHAGRVNAEFGNCGTLLHAASYHGPVDLVRLLLQHNADVNARNNRNETPLHHAAQAEVARLLLEHGAFVDAQSGSHKTPLYQASELGHRDVVRVLLEHGAVVHIRGEKDQTPFQVATSNGHVEVAQLLSEHGAEKE
jgi:Ankyrin repeats (many copies)/Ankyrin repeats (3 copies)